MLDDHPGLGRDGAETQPEELVAHSGLRHAEHGGEVACVERPGLESCEEPEPGRIAERGEERVGATELGLAVHQPGAGGVYGVGVDAADGAGEGIGRRLSHGSNVVAQHPRIRRTPADSLRVHG